MIGDVQKLNVVLNGLFDAVKTRKAFEHKGPQITILHVTPFLFSLRSDSHHRNCVVNTRMPGIMQ